MTEQTNMPEGIAETRIQENLRTKAKTLSLDSLGLRVLPESIRDLTHLETLYLHSNRLTTLPNFIGHLPQLRTLWLHENTLTHLPESIGHLNQLRTLWLQTNQLSTLPASICDLAKLEELDVAANALTELPQAIGKLTALKKLVAYRTPLSTLPASFSELTELQELSLPQNSLRELPETFGELTNLTELYLSNNLLCALPDSIVQLSALKILYLHGNHLSTLPKALVKLSEAGTLLQVSLHDNDSLGIPAEILGPGPWQTRSPDNATLPEDKQLTMQDPRRIARYWRQLQAGPSGPLNEAKVLLVGPGGHGKSSLIEYLRDGTFKRGKTSTDGIKVVSWIVPKGANDADLRLNVWDFGGQEIQHSTHEFFLTERAVYLLVFQPRDDMATAQGLYYWLDLIHLVAPNAPVIVVLSKQDEFEGHVNDAADLKQLHPKLVDFIPISCDKTHSASRNVPRLRQLVLDTISEDIRHVRYKLPASWIAVKQKLEQRGLDHLSYVGYQELCVAQGIIDSEDQKLLARFLNDLGTMLNYADRMPLEQTHILNPAWVTEGVYAVVLSPQLRDAEGVFDEQLLATLLSDRAYKGRYPVEAQRFILQMMLSFRLCYELSSIGGHRRYLVPNALPDNPSDGADADLDDALRFEIRFPRILPTSVMSRFIVAMHSQRREDKRWRLGLRSHLNGHDFLVTAHPKQRRIRITVAGTGPTRTRVLEVIRQHFAVICREKEGLGARTFTFPPDYPNSEPYPFDSLLEAERNGVESIWLAGGIGNVSVSEWLDGVSDKESRREIQAAIVEAEKRGVSSGQLSIYHIEHAEHVGGLNMSKKQNLTQNIAGSTFTNSPVAIQQMLQGSFNTIQSAPEGEVKLALQELHKHVAALLAHPEIRDAETVRGDLENFAKEATKTQPRRKFLEVSGEGLIDAAKTVAAMSGPIIATVQKVLGLLAT
jgi:internalin A